MKHLFLTALIAGFAAFGTLAAEDTQPACKVADKDCTEKECATACDATAKAEKKAADKAADCADCAGCPTADKKSVAQAETDKPAEAVAK